jgi:formylglycine-generating enzyme required for sulfatase activity
MRMRAVTSSAVLLGVILGRPVAAPQESRPAAAAPEVMREFTNSSGMKFVLIEPGTFVRERKKESRRVTLTESFYLQVTEVTQAQWRAVMGNNPSDFVGPNRPVEQVSWNDAQEFLKKLNAKEKGGRYRLPTEAEWEYAARAGDTGKPTNLDAVAWWPPDRVTHPVGQKEPNGWGLYDMLGNVWEWCEDWYDKDYYRNSPSVNPKGPESGTYRVLRGGSWHSYSHAREWHRLAGDAGVSMEYIGFRCARDVFL